MDTKQLARAEREDLAAFLATLTPEQWEQPSLCTGWRVRDVVAHMVNYLDLSPVATAAQLVKGQFRLGRTNAVGVREFSARTPAELLALLDNHLTPRGLTAAFGGMVGLLDATIHHQDIRRPLGMPREVLPERPRRALELAKYAPPIGAFWRARGLRLIATDIDWTTGRGPDLRGPGEAVLLAIAGRADALADLEGPGRAILTNRIG